MINRFSSYFLYFCRFCAAQFSYCRLVSTSGTQTDSGTGTVEFQGKCYMSLKNLLSQVQVCSVVNQSYLPTTNEVWGKVMFSEVFVYPPRGRSAPGLCQDRRGALCQEEVSVRRDGLADGTHPTGILSSFYYFPLHHVLIYCEEISSMRIQDLLDRGCQLKRGYQPIILTIFSPKTALK